MPLSAFSIGMITAEVISSGAAPGSRSEHVHGRGIGAREQIDAEIAERKDAEHHQRHDEHRREHRSADAEFRQHDYSVFLSSVWVGRFASPACHAAFDRRPPPAVTFMPSARLSTSVSATRSPSFSAVQNFHAIADPVAGLQFVDDQRDRRSSDERAVHAVAVLHGRVRDGQHLLDERGGDVHARERAGLQQAVAVGHRSPRTRTRASAC